MFRIIIFIFILISANLFSDNTPTLRINKQDIVKEQKKEIEENAKKLKYDWISPLILQGSYSKTDTQNDSVVDTSINLSQDIFRSGGILYKIDYADTKRKSSLNSLSFEYTSFYKQLYANLLELKKLKLMAEQTELTLKNTAIEVFLKSQQYKTGDVDITELNRALREKNSALKAKLSAKQAIVEKEITLKKLTSKDLDSIEVPRFKLIPKDEYKEKNYDLLISKLDSRLSNYSYKLTTSAYLPKLTVNGVYGYRDNPNINFKDDYYSMGLSLSMPLDFNYYSNTQESKAAYLSKKLQIKESNIDVEAAYRSTQTRIDNYKEYKDITIENIKLYSELIDITQKALDSGVKSGYDLKTLKNTKKIDELELEINDLNIQIELANLIFATKIGENYYE